MAAEALFVDVLSITVGRYDELDGFWPEDTPVRESIPNSIWLPNVGFGRPDQDMQDYLMSNVSDRAQAGDPIVVFCIDSCWMGWNATQHLANAGYSNVHWFPQGRTIGGGPVILWWWSSLSLWMSTEWIVKSSLTT